MTIFNQNSHPMHQNQIDKKEFNDKNQTVAMHRGTFDASIGTYLQNLGKPWKLLVV